MKWSLATAYPRSRGATSTCDNEHTTASGLSPLARGNLKTAPRVTPIEGPIPARAGQPQVLKQGKGWRRAYPRSRGATHRRYACRPLA